MHKTKKTIISLILSLSMLIVMGAPVCAAQSDTWSIDYHPGVSPAMGNRFDSVVVSYYSGGYIANCKTISGTNGRALSITSTSAGGMNGISSISVTATGFTRSWTMKDSTTGNVTFKVEAVSGYRCQSTGEIKILGS